jgi:hypothetical protein
LSLLIQNPPGGIDALSPGWQGVNLGHQASGAEVTGEHRVSGECSRLAAGDEAGLRSAIGEPQASGKHWESGGGDGKMKVGCWRLLAPRAEWTVAATCRTE